VKRMGEKKRGGQPGNANAMKHGRYSVSKRAERRAALIVADGGTPPAVRRMDSVLS